MIIAIEQLSVFCIIGLLEHERKVPQELIVDAGFKADEFVDYALVRTFFTACFKDNDFDTLENAQNHTAKAFFRTFQGVQYLDLKLTKPNIFGDCKVSIQRKWDNVLY